MSSPIILALDTKDVEVAAKWIEISRDSINHYKIGLEFFLKHGVSTIKELKKRFDFELFLDLKLYDIPNTVKGAVESIADLAPKFLTVHAAGGAAMIKSACSALPNGSITAVTVLTSFTEDAFANLGYKSSIENTVKMWAKSAIDAGATSIVCSPFEAAMIRQISDSITIITPGVRVEGDDVGDQARVMTPKMAITNGADFVVIGRSITSQWNESATAMQSKISTILESINN